MPDAGTLGPALLLALIPSLLYVLVLNAIDRYEKEPWSILIASLGAGAILAPAASVAILALAGRPATLLPAFAPGAGGTDPLTGIVEELVKGVLLLTVIHWIRDEFDDILDGVVYGAALGAGFGAAETFLFASGGIDLLGGGTIASLLVAGLNHAFYTAILGAFLGAARRLADRRQAWTVAGLALATAALAHSLHDSLPSILARLLDRPDAALAVATRLVANAANVLGILTLAVVVVAAWRREARILQVELADEVTAGVVGAADYATIVSTRARLSRQLGELRSGGVGDVLALRRLYAAEGELAFHKRRVAAAHRRRAADPARVDELRARIRELRAVVEDHRA